MVLNLRPGGHSCAAREAVCAAREPICVARVWCRSPKVVFLGFEIGDDQKKRSSILRDQKKQSIESGVRPEGKKG